MASVPTPTYRSRNKTSHAASGLGSAQSGWWRFRMTVASPGGSGLAAVRMAVTKLDMAEGTSNSPGYSYRLQKTAAYALECFACASSNWPFITKDSHVAVILSTEAAKRYFCLPREYLRTRLKRFRFWAPLVEWEVVRQRSKRLEEDVCPDV